MAEKDEKVVRIDQTMFRGLPEKIIRVFDDELIQGLASSDQDGQRLLRSPPDPPCLLIGTGNGSRITRNHTGIQISDVDPEFKGIGGDDRLHLLLPQSLFDLPADFRKIPSPVSPDLPPILQSLLKSILQIFG